MKKNKDKKKDKKDLIVPILDMEKLASGANEMSDDMIETTDEMAEAMASAPETEELKSVASEDDSAYHEKRNEEMEELVADFGDVKYTDDEIEEMDIQRMAHVIMNDESRTDHELLSEVFGEDEYSRKIKAKEEKKFAKMEQRRLNGDTKGVRFLGIFSILMVLAGVALVLVTIYFLAVAPTYNKTDYLKHDLKFEDSATLSDADYTQEKEGYYLPEIATGDAVMEQGGEADE